MKKPVKKKKTTKQKLDDILEIAAEELFDNEKDQEPFEDKTKITAKTLSQELELSKPKSIETFSIPENTEDADFEYARNELYRLLQKASMATDGILGVCNETEHPRSYEVAGQLIKITAEVTKELIALRKAKAELNKFKLPGDNLLSDIKSPGTEFVLTTSEMLNAIRKAKQEDK